MALTPDAQCRFLSLPRELRDLIYIHTLEQRSDPPTRTFRTIPPPGTDGQFYLWTEESTWKPLNLLVINHQIRSESQELITSLKSSEKLNFELDILAKGYIYTPKWTLLNHGLQPCSPLNLTVNLRILSTESFRHANPTNANEGHVFHTLLNFLSRFIFLGPSFLHHKPAFTTVGPHYISNLRLLITFQDYYTRATHAETVHECFRMCKALTRLDTIKEYIGKLEVEAEWCVRGEEYRRERTWDLKKAECDMEGGEEKLKEENWATMGFWFGEAWARKYQTSSRSESTSP